MTYKWMPASEKPQLSMSQSQQYGNSSVSPGAICIEDTTEEQGCPNAVIEFLSNMRWERAGSHPDTTEPLFTKEDKGVHAEGQPPSNLTEGMYYRWYEAVAYEHASMMMIGLSK